MFIKMLGVADLLTALVVLFSSVLPSEIIIGFGIYLLVKGGFFLLSGDKMSSIDVGVAVYIFLAANNVSTPVVTALASLFLLQKGAFSLLS